MGTCASKIKKKKLVKSPITVIPESAGKDNNSVPVTNSQEMAEEKGGAPKRTSFSSPSTNRISESSITENFAPAITLTTATDNGLTPVKSRWSFSPSKRNFGSSKDETFFDSHQWLQSDCEEDFFSVNGDFTPSRGNTPLLGNTPKYSISEKIPRFHNILFEEEKSRVSFSQSPKPRRKKLAELFRDSIREERVENLKESSENPNENSIKLSAHNSREFKIIEDFVEDQKNHKSLNYHHRCLPRFSSFKGSLMEKRKKKKKIHVK